MKDERPFDEPLPEHRYDAGFPVTLERRGVTSHLKQGNLWQKETMWRDSIVTRLKSVGRNDLAVKLNTCHQERSVRVCSGCKSARIFWNRCELKWCPICAERLARERREAIEWWVAEVRQPKHVVLTAKNTDNFSKEYVQWFKGQFAKLRRSSFAKNWRGGFYSLEATWTDDAHLHLHALVDAKWIDAGELARLWGALMGQDFAIVMVRDARDHSYLGEVAKYVVKGSELAKWSGDKLARFIDAITGVRMFGVFGTLYSKRTEMREFLDAVRAGRVRCECGCSSYEVHDAHCWEIVTGQTSPSIASIPPPQPTSHPILNL